MQHYPVYLNTRDERIVVSGAGECALAKLRLLIKSEAVIHVFGTEPHHDVVRLSEQDRIILHARPLAAGDVTGARLFYAANDEPGEDARVADIAHGEGALVNVVDNLTASQFITPAMVDRDPVTIAIGTEGAAPVLSRKIKADIEAMLPSHLGVLARLAKAFRGQAERIATGRARRVFWSRFYGGVGAAALAKRGEAGVQAALANLLEQSLDEGTISKPGHISFVGAGPGDPELLTLKARNTLHDADVVLYDRLVSKEILELARREAVLIETGKTGFGKTMKQDDINDLIITHGKSGAHVVRLKSGDPSIFGRLDEELEAVIAAALPYTIIPGITSAVAAAAHLGVSLTRRGRNSELRLITGHDVSGFAEQDWLTLAKPGATAAFYMSKRASRFIQGRLLMRGADPSTPVTIAFNISRKDQHIVASTLTDFPLLLRQQSHKGPAVLMLGLAPRAVHKARPMNTMSGAA